MKKYSRILVALLIFCMSVTGFVSCGKHKEAEEEPIDVITDPGINVTEVKIAIQPSAAFIPLYVAKNAGWIEEALAPYGVTVKWNTFSAGPPMNESLAMGESDFGVIGDVPTVSGVFNTGKTEVIAIAAQAARSYAMLVAPDSDVTEPSQLVGATVATVVGSTSHNMVDKYMRSGGFTIDDVQLVSITTGDAADMLRKGEVKAVSIWEPNVTRLSGGGVAKILSEGPDVGLAGTNAIVANKEFVDNNPTITKIILEQYKRGAEALPTLSDEEWGDVGSDLSVTTSQIKEIVKKFDYTIVISEKDMDDLNDTIDFLVRIGNLPEDFDIRDYTDGSFADEVMK